MQPTLAAVRSATAYCASCTRAFLPAPWAPVPAQCPECHGNGGPKVVA